jgi:hypothetical protein
MAEPTNHRSDEDRVPVSLAPLTPEEALRALLAVKPNDEPADDTEAPAGSSEVEE